MGEYVSILFVVICAGLCYGKRRDVNRWRWK